MAPPSISGNFRQALGMQIVGALEAQFWPRTVSAATWPECCQSSISVFEHMQCVQKIKKKLKAAVSPKLSEIANKSVLIYNIYFLDLLCISKTKRAFIIQFIILYNFAFRGRLYFSDLLCRYIHELYVCSVHPSVSMSISSMTARCIALISSSFYVSQRSCMQIRLTCFAAVSPFPPILYSTPCPLRVAAVASQPILLIRRQILAVPPAV